jgi:hypothetical protein
MTQQAAVTNYCRAVPNMSGMAEENNRDTEIQKIRNTNANPCGCSSSQPRTPQSENSHFKRPALRLTQLPVLHSADEGTILTLNVNITFTSVNADIHKQIKDLCFGRV